MDTLCGSSGGWRRLAYLYMSDAAQSCPSGFRLFYSGSVRACGRPGASASCVSVRFQPNGISYSQICGRVTGYQYSSTNAFDRSLGSDHDNLTSYYVDGVSITCGSALQQVWTFAAGVTENSLSNPSYICLCIKGSIKSVPSFVIITTVNLVITILIGGVSSTYPIHSGMVKVVVLLKHLVVMLLVSHGFTETMLVIPLLTILSRGCVLIKDLVMKTILLAFMKYTLLFLLFICLVLFTYYLLGIMSIYFFDDYPVVFD